MYLWTYVDLFIIKNYVLTTFIVWTQKHLCILVISKNIGHFSEKRLNFLKKSYIGSDISSYMYSIQLGLCLYDENRYWLSFAINTRSLCSIFPPLGHLAVGDPPLPHRFHGQFFEKKSNKSDCSETLHTYQVEVGEQY